MTRIKIVLLRDRRKKELNCESALWAASEPVKQIFGVHGGGVIVSNLLVPDVDHFVEKVGGSRIQAVQPPPLKHD